MEKRCYKMHGVRRKEENGKRYLEGYFARFNEVYNICAGWIETIRKGAFREALEAPDDIKALWNHSSDVVLGSRAAGTLTLIEDEQGLMGRIEINEKDTDATNVYARVERGDVDGCSFGFEAEFAESEDPDGNYRTEIVRVTRLYEVSPCTFPAYESTSIAARSRERLQTIQTERRAARLKEWRAAMHKKLKGEPNGTESNDAAPQH